MEFSLGNRNVFDISYIGYYPAISASGGFIMEQGLQTITMIPVQEIGNYDVTLAIQIYMDVRFFNEKIGLYKDPTNTIIWQTAFDKSTNRFPTDTITVTAEQFIDQVRYTPQILSVGKLNTLYSDFIAYVNDYFSYADGFSSLFNLSSVVDINGGVFDASALLQLIQGNTYDPVTEEYIQDLSGAIQITDINKILNAIVYSNPFQNRTEGNTNQDGFLAGDLIFVPDGVTTVLNLNIQNSQITLNSLGLSHTQSLTEASNYQEGYFSSYTTNTETNIQRTVKAPLLIILSNAL